MQLYFDSHAHYDHERFGQDREAIIASLREHSVGWVINSASDAESSRNAVALSKRYPFFFASAGVHPHEASSLDDVVLDEVAALCGEKNTVALGEIGLDFHYDFSPREVQRQAFRRQLALAKDLDIPVIIHSREASRETFDLVKEFRPRGVIHCFSGSAELAEEYMQLGMYLGFTGAVTFEGAKKPFAAAAACHRERILIETDCPYMAPVPYRGKRCDSTMLPKTAEVLARAQRCDTEEIIRATRENACACFGISESELV